MRRLYLLLFGLLLLSLGSPAGAQPAICKDCRLDFNKDGIVDQFDIGVCFNCVVPCSPTVCDLLDFNSNGIVDLSDLTNYATMCGDPNVCVTPIPTLSPWGLILFPVVLLTAMGAALWRRRSARMNA